MDNSIHRINRYPVDSVVCFVKTYPLDNRRKADITLLIHRRVTLAGLPPQGYPRRVTPQGYPRRVTLAGLPPQGYLHRVTPQNSIHQYPFIHLGGIGSFRTVKYLTQKRNAVTPAMA